MPTSQPFSSGSEIEVVINSWATSLKKFITAPQTGLMPHACVFSLLFVVNMTVRMSASHDYQSAVDRSFIMSVLIASTHLPHRLPDHLIGYD